ncbi:MAG: polyribonucleotide nucleotidyltransferase [Armatimonadota bacterium]|nr:polyribonucleotide nucleotidyltransferase [Armatimonadota bacterium]MDR7438408.1 polyribonucleotide nucleotidyltransferase [Armatimonadota bacterium]MDR7562207.1 polyribonucleotide nucleotidyltransferase [Armatimonadota bacterium]MDR7567187.1 polyribonucleotide nucleotidyltransferase [Armatimonadota bacterium]MDR7601252.1 polyribonucleotide nucleotidyltransferase [Armatimonadota bacterium]
MAIAISYAAPEVHRVTFSVGDEEWVIETGKLARQANGAVTVRYGETVVLVTATASENPREGIDFLPLTCEFEERLYAAGKIPGSFFRREGRPGERAILSARLMDRPLRPLFPKGFRNEVQVIATTLSADKIHPPDVAAVVGASAALAISDVPWEGPIGCVRVGWVDGRLILNPTLQQIEGSSRLDLVVAATDEAVVMLEAGGDQVPEEVVLEAIDLAHAECRRIIAAIRELVEKAGKPKRQVPLFTVDPELERVLRETSLPALDAALRNADKQAREAAVARAAQEVSARLLEQYPDRALEIKTVLEAIQKDLVRRMILEEGVRTDGRTPTEIRPLYIEVGLMPRTHGSALFQRGQTQVLTLCTLGTGEDEQILDDLGILERKRFMHHYVFPPYSTGEVRPLRGPSRREIGHGALAERALARMIPPEEEFPYTIRLVSEVLESNGSTSMASVCGSTLALMDAGVPIRAPVAGISIGLMTGEDGRAVLLTDIQGIEDAHGDMDFKVAGTREGITAIQLDIKLRGLPRDLIAQALSRAREAREAILDAMLRVLPAPRSELSKYAPRLVTLQIPPEKIREVIGPGGKVINRITAETGTRIEVEQDGRVIIASTSEEAAQRAMQMIREIVREVEVGQTYLGRVTRLTSFGAFVEVLPGKEGLVHISELSDRRVNRVEDVVKVGDQILVRVKEIDALGRVNLTRRGLTPEEEVGEAPASAAPARGREDRRPDRGRPVRPDTRPRRPEPRR